MSRVGAWDCTQNFGYVWLHVLEREYLCGSLEADYLIFDMTGDMKMTAHKRS